jgi:flagellar basal body-associated protein FliL
MSCLELISDIVVFVVVVVFIVFTVNSSGIKSHKICAQAEIKISQKVQKINLFYLIKTITVLLT